MKKLYIRDRFRRKLVYKHEIDRLVFKFLLMSSLSFSLKSLFVVFNSRKLVYKNLIRINNRCYFSNRGHSVFKFFKISRIILKEFGSFGFINGLRKSSW